jgi:retron-type reverse transcriptase
MDIVIEGDIKGAFDNVNHDIMIQISSEKVKDNRLLKLIKGGLKCGVIYLILQTRFRIRYDSR